MKTMHNVIRLTVLALMSFGLASSVRAQAIPTASASHNVTLEVLEINTISLADANVQLVIDADDAPAAGSDTYSESATTAYSFSSNGDNKKIIGAMDVAPSKGQLRVNLTAPSVGVSMGSILLGTSPQTLVTNISRVAGSALGMQYVYSVNVSEGTMPSETKTITYTLLDS